MRPRRLLLLTRVNLEIQVKKLEWSQMKASERSQVKASEKYSCLH
jgi:hypothetical protein